MIVRVFQESSNKSTSNPAALMVGGYKQAIEMSFSCHIGEANDTTIFGCNVSETIMEPCTPCFKINRS
ncbi:hypothetical protein Mal15_64510 [Stieleria maiorica]|uniref:Uncharacterized protein n=1 Tax=Stieleria maiorica TaxID=2795974 RepID=A0A5B9MN47_9BACT|nr:hypothetical protein Mal15_64510 [Stieleria maiorica]